MPIVQNLSGGFAQRSYNVLGVVHTMRLQLKKFSNTGQFTYLTGQATESNVATTLQNFDTALRPLYSSVDVFLPWSIHIATSPTTTTVVGSVTTTIPGGTNGTSDYGKSKETIITYRTAAGNLGKVALFSSNLFPLGPIWGGSLGAGTTFANTLIGGTITLSGKDGTSLIALVNISTSVNKHVFRKVGY